MQNNNGVSRAPAAGGALPMLQFRHYITLPGYYFNGNCQFLWSMFLSELATVQPCTTSWIHKVTGKRIDRPCTDSLTPLTSVEYG